MAANQRPIPLEKKRLMLKTGKRTTVSQRLLTTLNNNDQMKWFEKFLDEEDGNENLCFWIAVEEFKKMTDPDILAEKAVQIWDDFLSQHAATPVNLPPELVAPIENAIKSSKIDNSSFNDAQEEIFSLLKVDPFPRFLQSCFYSAMYKAQVLKEKNQGSLIPDEVFQQVLRDCDMQTDQGWGPPIYEKRALQVHRKVYKDPTPVNSLRVTLTIRAPSDAVFSALLSLEKRAEWDDHWDSGSTVETLNQGVNVLHLSYRANPANGGSRDYCVLNVSRIRQEECIALFRSVVHNQCPVRRGFARLEMELGAYVVQAKSPTECQLIAFIQAEGKTPKAQIDRAMCFKGFRNMVEMDHLRSSKIPFSIEFSNPKKAQKQRNTALRNRLTVSINRYGRELKSAAENWVSTAPQRKATNPAPPDEDVILIGRKVSLSSSTSGVIQPLSSELMNVRDMGSEISREDCPFFWTQIGRVDAESLLRKQSCDCFLLRPSSRDNSIAVSVFNKRENYITHTLLIKKADDAYFLQDTPERVYRTVTEFCLEEPDLHTYFPLSFYSCQPAHISGRVARGNSYRPKRFCPLATTEEQTLVPVWGEARMTSFQQTKHGQQQKEQNAQTNLTAQADQQVPHLKNQSRLTTLLKRPERKASHDVTLDVKSGAHTKTLSSSVNGPPKGRSDPKTVWSPAVQARSHARPSLPVGAARARSNTANDSLNVSGADNPKENHIIHINTTNSNANINITNNHANNNETKNPNNNVNTNNASNNNVNTNNANNNNVNTNNASNNNVNTNETKNPKNNVNTNNANNNNVNTNNNDNNNETKKPNNNVNTNNASNNNVNTNTSTTSTNDLPLAIDSTDKSDKNSTSSIKNALNNNNDPKRTNTPMINKSTNVAQSAGPQQDKFSSLRVTRTPMAQTSSQGTPQTLREKKVFPKAGAENSRPPPARPVVARDPPEQIEVINIDTLPQPILPSPTEVQESHSSAPVKSSEPELCFVPRSSLEGRWPCETPLASPSRPIFSIQRMGSQEALTKRTDPVSEVLAAEPKPSPSFPTGESAHQKQFDNLDQPDYLAHSFDRRFNNFLREAEAQRRGDLDANLEGQE